MEEFIKQFSSDIVNKVTDDGVRDQLWKKGAITGREKHDIGDLSSSAKNRSKLADVLVTKDPYVARIFVDAFEEWSTGKEDLVEAFRQALCDPVYSQHRQPLEYIWYGFTDVTHNFTGRQEELESLHNYLYEDRDENSPCHTLLTSIHGIGGVGKTSLAKQYAWEYRKFYDNNVIWINSEDIQTMTLAIAKVANKIGVRCGDRLRSVDLAQNIYLRLGNKKCLIIFDNVIEYEGVSGIKDYLPNDGLPPTLNKPYVLLTSRDRTLIKNKNKNKLLELDVFTPEDAVQLVQRFLPNATKKIIHDLVNKLDRFPLALSQALAYIELFKDQFELEDDAIKMYLDKFNDEKSRRELLKSDKSTDGSDNYKFTVYTTWKVTLDRLSKPCQALSKILAYLAPENIKTRFLHHLPGFDEEQVMNAIADLSKYSIIKSKQGLVHIHRLIQEIVRIDITDEVEVQIVKTVLQTLERAYSCGTDLEIQAILHGTTLLRFVEKHRAQLNQFSEFTINLKFDGENLKFIRQELACTEGEAAKLIWRLNRLQGAIKLAVVCIKNTKPPSVGSVDDYILAFDSKFSSSSSSSLSEYSSDQLKIARTTWAITLELIRQHDFAETVLHILEWIRHHQEDLFRIRYANHRKGREGSSAISDCQL